VNSFIENICNTIINKHKDIISDICVVFPSRRAGIFFKNELSKKISTPIWSPSVYSIQDFIEELSTFNFTDNIELLFELYSVYSDVITSEKIEIETSNDYIESYDDEESFDSFYPWGEMLLKDFDTIDKFLIDKDILFKRIKELKEIEENFPIELQETFKKFWGTLFESNSTLVKKNFLKIWQVLGRVYIEYKEKLISKNLCYPGMAYRKLHEDLKNGMIELKWKKIVFAGFNALNTSEKKIMGMLMDKGLAEICWDADDYYVSDKNQEAGNFIRKNIKLFNQNEIKFENNFVKEKKSINVIGISSSVGMAKALGSELKEMISEGNMDIEKTAIVLPEEKLLLPVLYSIPEEIKNINITMGFPFKDTPLCGLINLLIELQSNYVFEKGEYKFHHSSIEKILLHPYIKFQNTGIIYNILEYLKKNNVVYYYFNNDKKDIPLIIKYIFRKISAVSEIEEYLKRIMDIVVDRIEKDESSDSEYKKFQLEYIYHFYLSFNRLNEVIHKFAPEMKTETYWKLLKELFANTSIPFAGEPLKGLQIMGLLETRALDFENVFLLSVNEGVLPQGHSENSFIPYSLRKALKMPTYEDEDSVKAYYFYRLLQKAKNIFLFYNMEIDQDVKEKSRYILQLENELIPLNKNIEYANKIVVSEIYSVEKKSIEVKKDIDIFKKIKNIEHYSPTTIREYINCTLQFYFKEIAKIEEEKEIEESFSSMLIGNVLHNILEEIYKPYKKKTVNEEDINNINKTLEGNYDSILENAVKANKSEYILKEYEGKNYLFKDIIYKLLIRVLENEKTQTPFKIIDLEKKIRDILKINPGDNLVEVNIEGRIDRVDEKDGVTRIIDYKTGNYELKKYNEKNPSEYFEELISNPDYKDNFQAFFYAYFFSRISGEKKINVGIYPIKKMQNGIDDLKTGYIEESEFELFEESLEKMFMEIYNPDIPFKQVEDEKRCMFCHYSGICYRDLKNTI
jgi:hypothetical protein